MILSSAWYLTQHVPQFTKENMLLSSPKIAWYSAHHGTQLSMFLKLPKKTCYSDHRRKHVTQLSMLLSSAYSSAHRRKYVTQQIEEEKHVTQESGNATRAAAAVFFIY
jgi:hypothetical protein